MRAAAAAVAGVVVFSLTPTCLLCVATIGARVASGVLEPHNASVFVQQLDRTRSAAQVCTHTYIHTHAYLMSIVGSILGFVSAVLVRSALVTVGVLLVPRVNTRALPGAEGTASRSFCMLRA